MNARVAMPPAREACPTQARRMLAEGARLVDVRELADVAETAFDEPGVLLMPLSELAQRYAELPRDRELVLVCLAGDRSLAAASFLMAQGYHRVSHMPGGLIQWAVRGLPIQGGPHAPAGGATDCCPPPAVASDGRRRQARTEARR